MLPQVEGGSKFRGLQEGEKIEQSLLNRYFVTLMGGQNGLANHL